MVEKNIQEGVFEEVEEVKEVKEAVKESVEEETKEEETAVRNGVLVYTDSNSNVGYSYIGEVTLKDMVFFKEYLSFITEKLVKQNYEEK